MADTLFIKAAAFCGYDKNDVDKRLDALYSLIYNLKNEIRENKQILKKYEEGFSQDKAYENAIAVERAQLTQLQVKNENLAEKNKARTEELKIKEQENSRLLEEVAQLKEEVEELRLKQLALKNNDTEDLGIIFIEAKKSRDLIVNNAKQEAAVCMEEAKKFSENLIAETNEKIKNLIENAEKKTAELLKESENKKKTLAEEEANLKQNFLEKLAALNNEINNIKNSVDTFTSASADFFSNSKDLIESAESKINCIGETAKAENNDVSETEAAASENIDNNQTSSTEENNQKDNANPKTVENNNSAENGINLDDLLKQAKELNKV